mgnify:CR=1 FL=1
MKYLFDTDTCISLIDAREPARQKAILARLERLRDTEVVVSTISVFELSFGVENSAFREVNRQVLDALLLDFRIAPFDEPAAREAGVVRATLEKAGKRISPMDVLIAGHAKALGVTIVAGNLSHFSRIKGLKVENWSA